MTYEELIYEQRKEIEKLNEKIQEFQDAANEIKSSFE